MRFEFNHSSAEDGRLRVIPEIPDFPLCRIEGRNGIGKTLAVRLLEVVSGSTPFAALPHAWDSLVEELGVLEIRITRQSGPPIVCSLDSSLWRGRTQADVANDPGQVVINGAPASWAAARELVHVRRIAGDESLQDTLGRILRERAIIAQRRRDQHALQLSRWGAAINGLLRICGAASRESLEDADSVIAQAERMRVLAAERFAAVQADVDGQAREARNLDLLAQQANRLPPALASYEAAYEALHAAVVGSEDEERRLIEAATAQSQSAGVADAIQRWSRLLELRIRAVDRAEADQRFADITAQDQDGSIPTTEELEQRIASVREQIESGYAAGAVRGVLRDAASPLEQVAEGSVLDNHFVTIDRPISGRELLTALERRRGELRDVPKPDDTAMLERQLRRYQEQLAALDDLADARDLVLHKTALVDEAVNALNALNAKLAQGDGPSLTEALTSARRAVAEAGGDVATAYGELRSLLGNRFAALLAESISEGDEDADIDSLDAVTGTHEFPDPAEVRADVGEALAEAAVRGGDGAEDQLAGRLQALARVAHEAEEELRQVLVEAARDLQVAEADVATARSRRLAMVFEIRAGVDSLALPAGPWARWRPVVIASFDGPEAFTALQQSLADSTGDASGAGADYDGAAGLARLRTALETVESAATEDRSAWDAAGAFLDANAMQLAPRLGAGLGQPRFAFSGGPAIPVLRRWTETELAQVLSSEALRRELFDESPTVSIDLDEFAVAWRDRAGRRRSRPLEAFSSGEQVFAYTRAKLEEIAESGRSIDSTVLVLDEFGAFVARDRFGQLLQYVEDDALGRIADQVVVMLPLSAGAALAGSEAEAELESRSYFAVPGMELA